MPVPELSTPLDMHITQLPEITMWVGYTDGFCQFAGRGWFCGLFGSILLFVSFSRPVRVLTGGKDGDLAFPGRRFDSRHCVGRSLVSVAFDGWRRNISGPS